MKKYTKHEHFKPQSSPAQLPMNYRLYTPEKLLKLSSGKQITKRAFTLRVGDASGTVSLGLQVISELLVDRP